jgi:YVTN family beta-propeller protein
VIETPALKIARTLPAGHTAFGAALSPDGKRLYVCNCFNNNVSVLDLITGKEITRVPVTREPYGAVATPDGKSVFVINRLPLDPADGNDVAAVVTVIDTKTNQPSTIRLLNGSTSLHGITISPDGKYVYVAHILARYQMPTTQLERGWMSTNALTIINAADKKLVNSILLDDVDLGAANPWGVACSADGNTVCVAHAGSHELSVINMAGVFEKLAKIPLDDKTPPPLLGKDGKPVTPPSTTYQATSASSTQADVPNDLAFLVDLRRRVGLEGKGPRGVAIAGGKAYVAQYFSDSLAVVDLAPKPDKLVSGLPLGPRPEQTVQRRGEALFHDATICFQHWQSCASCHPDARVDALNWDLMNDGLGNPKNNKSMLLSHRTPPSMWTGIRPTAESAVREGITHILFAVRPEEEAVAMDEYLKALEPVPSPHLDNGQLSEAARRGKAIFFREEIGCAQCHPEPLYTDKKLHDLNPDRREKRPPIDTPTLIECWRTAPYMHDGHWVTIKELLTKGRHGHSGTKAGSLTEKEIDDLVAFVLSL